MIKRSQVHRRCYLFVTIVNIFLYCAVGAALYQGSTYGAKRIKGLTFYKQVASLRQAGNIAHASPLSLRLWCFTNNNQDGTTIIVGSAFVVGTPLTLSMLHTNNGEKSRLPMHEANHGRLRRKKTLNDKLKR